MKTVRSAAAACALLAMAGCGAAGSPSGPDTTEAVARAAAAPTSTSGEPVAVAGTTAKFGDPQQAGGGLVVTVSAPKSFTPSDTAYPRSPRAVAFDITIDNQGTSTYRPTQLIIKAVAKGAIAEQVADATQGYGRIAGATDDVPPDKVLRLTLAFAVPAEQVGMRVTVQPDASAAQTVVEFAGMV